jgi:hypothetical protein
MKEEHNAALCAASWPPVLADWGLCEEGNFRGTIYDCFEAGGLTQT